MCGHFVLLTDLCQKVPNRNGKIQEKKRTKKTQIFTPRSL